MTWFKVDDSFYDHPKFLDLSNAAIGLWVKAGAWCGKHLTDGVIPAAKVKSMKGTPAQIRALIECGLWVESESESGAKAYRFHDWNDFQPTREVKLKERQLSAERQRKSRERKAQEQEQQENVTRDSHVTGQRDSRVSHRQVSQRPDPTRPDPTNKEEGSSSLTVSRGPDPTPSEPADDRVEAASASPPADDWPTLDDLAAQRQEQLAGATPDAWSTPDDPRCREHAGLPRDEVPPCGACGRVRAWFTAQESATADARRTAIDACSWCDDRGMVDTHTTDGRPIAVKCGHNGPPAPPEATETAHKPLTDPNTRRALLDALKSSGGPF